MRTFLLLPILLGLAACVHTETVKESAPPRATVVTPAAPSATVIQTP